MLASWRHTTSKQLFERTACSPRYLATTSQIYVSKSHDPYFNLSVEDWLFRHADPEIPLLFLYRDTPCVVIGRNQNPWKEVNHTALRQAAIPFIRRRSGGGTVYHDLGNTNYSIHTSRLSFDRLTTGHLIRDALKSVDIPAYLNERNDICVDDFKICVFKRYSRSAYKIVNKRSYHHGTMLIDSDLNSLRGVLRNTKDTMTTKGVASVRSPVRNLIEWKRSFSHDEFCNAVIEAFREHYQCRDRVEYVEERSSIAHTSYVQNGMTELRTWDWLYGQTPQFTHVLQHSFDFGPVEATIHSRHGLILSCTLKTRDSSWEEDGMRDQRYAFLPPIRDIDGADDWDRQRRDIWEWLRVEMDR
ncbi:Lipoyltransferase and lipoate-protein ligase [Sistotremastrum suecicum HHB10207 ss-3]|uniref:Putative lipoate-protein ligase A n=1 Tax=Sistotremastrum suecicum HHB10207 ss-3 TaxID=1314776 RepID=A0A166BSA4_9AGAM|nr:Lipoyltransferase and lipoate-protein ligase [Sistotremastrum suecicum HHB10207 ss-3]